MRITFSLSGKFLEIGGVRIRAWCDVRTRANSRRGPKEVVYSIPAKLPYDPRPIPLGIWKVGRPVPKTDPYMAPYFIPTDAWQKLPVWEVAGGQYLAPTARLTTDRGYGIHFSTSPTTLGCPRVENEVDLVYLVHEIIRALNAGEEVTLEVKP